MSWSQDIFNDINNINGKKEEQQFLSYPICNHIKLSRLIFCNFQDSPRPSKTPVWQKKSKKGKGAKKPVKYAKKNPSKKKEEVGQH